ncbi:12548_t:CDS:10 [Ambispora gerdemannii]|uniref:12548_t:CDS:1 n=1 Tax=Ambispora gerdemannii TaxID=144530 RepID=A0A9N8VNX5_9GLOM|nr:12548_t:CDS:10 [Ambispora gerdemannii]
MLTKDPIELEKLQQFAEKGGIGACVANQDTLANTEDDLMFFEGDKITVLKHIAKDLYLGYCEGVIAELSIPPSGQENTLLNTVSSGGPRRQNSTPSSGQASVLSNTVSSGGPRRQNSTPPSGQENTLSNAVSLGGPRRQNSTPSSGQESALANTVSSGGPRRQNSTPSSGQENTLSNTVSSGGPRRQNSTPPSGQENTLLNTVSSGGPRRQNSTPSTFTAPEQPRQTQITPHRQNTSPALHNKALSIETKPTLLSLDPNKSSVEIAKSINSHQSPLGVNTSVAGRSPPGSVQNSPISPQSTRSGSTTPVLPPSTNSNNNTSNVPKNLQSVGNLKYQKSESLSPTSDNIQTDHMTQNTSNPIAYPLFNVPTFVIQPETPTRPTMNPNQNSLPKNTHIEDRTFDQSSPNSRSPSPNSSSQQMRFDSSSPPGNPYNHWRSDQSPTDSRSSSPISSPPHRSSSRPSSPISPLPHRSYSSHSPISSSATRVSSNISSNYSDDDDEEESLIAYSSSRNKRNAIQQSSTPNNQNTPHRLVVSTTPQSEQLSSNGSYDNTSDDDESTIAHSISQNREDETPLHKKEQILAVDNYGFVVDVSEGDIPEGADRIQRMYALNEFFVSHFHYALILKKFLLYSQAPGYSEKNSRNIRQYREREAKWLNIIATMDTATARESRRIKKLVRQGIPESVRGKAWQFMAGANKFRKPKVYEVGKSQSRVLRKRERLPIYDVIERDIHRCYPDHIQFREGNSSGQSDLYDILKAYAHYNPAVGYCQGMGRLVGMMLMQMPAEDTFWLLVATIEEYMNGYFTPTLSQLRIDSEVFKQLLTEHDPKLAQHLADNDIVPLMYMTQWFMTIFTMALPWASVLRIWDIFYFEGVKLFFRVGLAILDCTRDHILKKCPGSSEILAFLLHIPPDMLTPEVLLDAAFNIRIRRSSIRRLKKRIAMESNNEIMGNNKRDQTVLVKKQKISEQDRVKKVGGVEFRIES